MNLLIALGKRIQSIREKKGLTQEALARGSRVNAKYISAVERGQKNATIFTLEKIAKGLNVELYELFLLSEEASSEEALRKAIESLLRDANIRILRLCLSFLKQALD